MKLIYHFSSHRLSNTYLVGPDKGGEAIIIDPSVMDVDLLNLIEHNHYDVKHVLVTHHHRTHVDGIRTLKRIYDFNIYSMAPMVDENINGVTVGDGTVLRLSNFTVRVIGIGGHSQDSVAYLIGDHLFTGDVLSAGMVGSTPTPPAKIAMLKVIKEKLLTLPPETLIFPGHGAPSTIEAERSFNPMIGKAVDLKMI